MNKLLLSILPDFLLIIGFALLVYGAYLIYSPSSFIIAGIMLIVAFFPRSTSNSIQTNKQIKRKS